MYPIANHVGDIIRYIKSGTEFRVSEDYVDNSIYLTNQELTTLPDWFGNIVNREDGTQHIFKYLNLTNNQLTTIPESIGNLSNLVEMRLYNNFLISLPESIGLLTQLKYLDLSQNKLMFVPDSIGNLVNLKHLYLNNNNLLYIPETITRLHRLKYLNVNNNYLTDDNLEMLDRMNIPNVNTLLPQKQFIWPSMEGVGGIKELETNGKDLYNGEYGRIWDEYRWMQEFNPKGKKSLSSLRK